jgi:CubicO group peptidase (beta-lactamase class C family)
MDKSIFIKSMVISILFILINVSILSNSGSTQFITKDDSFFDNLIETLIARVHMSALSVGIIKDDTLLWSKGYGLYDREKNKEAKNDTIYLVASISKSITATALMQLYEQGYFDLDDDINDYINFSLRNPNHPSDNITFRMLLAHQSSLATDLPTSFTRMMPGEITIKGYPYPYLKELLVPDGMYFKPQFWMDYRPGTDMHYANVGFALLGYFVELFTGQSLEEYCQGHIFEPLEMKDTSFFIKNLDSSRVAVPYLYSKEYYPYSHYQILDYPAGGLRTTVTDLSHFLIAHMNNGVYNGTQILTSQSIEEMRTIQYASDTYDFQYGLGFQIWDTKKDLKIGHTGGLYGVATKMAYRSSDNIGIIMFINKALSNIRDTFVYSLIEYLLFQKAKGLDSSRILFEEISEIIQSNVFLLKECMLEDTIKDNLFYQGIL